MPTVNLGRVKMKWRGAWAGSTAYAKDDIVRHGVDTYVATTAHTAHATTFSNDSANWELMAQGADIPTQSGQTGKYLTTDGTDLSWGEVTQEILQTKLLYSSSTTSSGGTLRNYYSDFYAVEGVVIGGTFTKLSATSTIFTFGSYNGIGISGNPHAAGIWIASNKQSQASQANHTSVDPHRMSNPNSTNLAYFSLATSFEGVAAGTVGIWAAIGRGDSSGHDCAVNPNISGYTGNSDQVARNSHSSLWVMEVEL